jgi:hypothetical protein
MEYTTLVATKPGQPPVRAEKRTEDKKIFYIDFTPLLNDNELVYGEVSVSNTGLLLEQVQAKQGKYISFKAIGGPSDVPYADYIISFSVKTSALNELSVPIIIRVYSI